VIVLGIDPGTARTGYGIVSREGSRLRLVTYGCIETVPDRPAEARLLMIHEALGRLLEEHQPEAMGVERLFFNKNVQTAMAVGQARGVVLLAAAQHGLPLYEYGPHEVKLAVTGYGHAAKDQVQRMVQAVLAMDQLPRPDDAADALAVAVCTSNSARTQAAVRT
jgi:crossover junction endodeoxyribonuclease RuvC